MVENQDGSKDIIQSTAANVMLSPYSTSPLPLSSPRRRCRERITSGSAVCSCWRDHLFKKNTSISQTAKYKPVRPQKKGTRRYRRRNCLPHGLRDLQDGSRDRAQRRQTGAAQTV